MHYSLTEKEDLHRGEQLNQFKGVNMKNCYLKPTIKMEPLIWQWYAWSYLIAPTTAACNIVERHLKIMQSYVQNPQIHAQAVLDPKLNGGPFIDLEGQKINEIKELIENTERDCRDLILLHNSLKDLDRMLQQEAKGDSLETTYRRIPEILRGSVELVYDLNNYPSIRLIEYLFYKKFYSDKHQKIALSEMVSDKRKFVLSTPRINQDSEIYLNTPFSSDSLDVLFRMREHAADLSTVLDLFDIPAEKQALFASLFTNFAPKLPADRNYLGDGIRIRYFGHACVLLQSKDVSILFDPLISYPISSESVPRYTMADLPDKIDYVIITHNHQDHLMFETLLQIRHKIVNIVFPRAQNGSLQDPSIKFILEKTGFKSLIEMSEFEEIKLPEGRILALPFFGEHADLNIQTKSSYMIELKGGRYLFLADSNNFESKLYDHIYDEVGSPDILFIGMECDGAPLSWLYGPLLSQPLKRSFDNNRKLSGSNYDKAWTIAQKLKCRRAYVYAMGQEPWLDFISSLKYTEESYQIVESNKFVQSCLEQGIESERLFGKKEWIINS